MDELSAAETSHRIFVSNINRRCFCKVLKICPETRNEQGCLGNVAFGGLNVGLKEYLFAILINTFFNGAFI